MISLKYNITILFLLFTNQLLLLGFQIPNPKFQLNQFNNGFRVLIPDEKGIKIFAFHGSINHKIKKYEPGDFYGIASRISKSNEWIYENYNIKLHKNDILYFWLYIQYEQQGHYLLNQHISIDKFEITPILNNSNIGFIETGGRFDCELSQTIFNGGRVSVCSNVLIFEELFNNNYLNLTKWQYQKFIPSDLNDSEFVVYQEREENVYIRSGHLNIIPTLFEQIPGCNYKIIRNGILNLGPNCTGSLIDRECKRKAEFFRILPPIVSAKIRTKNSFSFRYGRIEIKAKLPKGDWIFPQIFLEPLDNYYGVNGFASGQIRIAFIRSNEILYNNYNESINGNRLYGGVILSNDQNLREHWLVNNLWDKHFGDDFHIYSLIWTNESITFKVDGINYGTINGGFNNYKLLNKYKNDEFMAPFNREFYISLGVSVGGISDFPDDCINGIERHEKPWINLDPKGELSFWRQRQKWLKSWKCKNTRMLIDYVKVWSL